MQSTNNPYKKSLLVVGIMTILLGLIIGIGTIIFNLNKYLNNLNKYTSEDKITLEEKMTTNDTLYDNYVQEINSLKLEKQTLQKELSDLPKTSNNSSKYLELEQQINTLTSRIEELEKLKYSSLTEKNNLRKDYNEVIESLQEKDSPKGIIKCYLVGLAIIIVSITTSAYLIYLSFQPDTDDLILKKQLEIDNANKKSDTEALKEATDKVLRDMTLENSKELSQSKKTKDLPSSKSSGKRKTTNSQATKTNKHNNSNNTHNSNRNKKTSSSKSNSNSKNTTKTTKE